MHITDYEKVNTLNETDLFLLDGARGTKTIFARDLGPNLINQTPSQDITEKVDFSEVERTKTMLDSSDLIMNTSDGIRRLSKWDLFYETGRKPFYYRGKSLGNTFTAEQKQAIRNKDFSDLCIGDFWRINNYTYTIADWDYLNGYVAGEGSTLVTTPHITVIVEYSPAVKAAKMHHVSSIVDVGYKNCDWRTGNNDNTDRAKYRDAIYSAFGENNIMKYIMPVQDSIILATSGCGRYGITYSNANCDIELLSEDMVYGHKQLGSIDDWSAYGSSITMYQLALFKLAPNIIRNTGGRAFRDLSGTNSFTMISWSGAAGILMSDNEAYLMPYFFLTGNE